MLVFILGACGLAYEYNLSKTASDLLGNSVRQWAMMIATMLFAMGAGAELQKHTPPERTAERLVSTQILLALLGGFGPLILLYAFALVPDVHVLFQYGTAFGVGLLIGYEIPLLLRINESASPEIRTNLAQVLKMDYIGALAGALVWTFLLVPRLNIQHTSFLTAAATLVAAGICLALHSSQIRKPRRWWLVLTCAAAIIAAGIGFGPRMAAHGEQFLYRDPIIAAVTSPYQHIVLTKNRKGIVRCYINNNLQFNETDEAIYHESLVHPAMQLAPSRQEILILGGGDGLALREVLKYPDVRAVTLVDLDPEMTRLAATHPELTRINQHSLNHGRVTRIPARGLSPGPSATLGGQPASDRFKSGRLVENATVHSVNVDAAEFVKSAPGRYHVILMDFPDPNSPDLAKLYGRPFYDQLHPLLMPGGVIVQQSGSPVQAREAFLCTGRTLQAAGFAAVPYHDHVPSFGEWGWWIAVAGQSADATSRRLQAVTSCPVPTQYWNPGLLRASLAFGNEQLTSRHNDITSPGHPAVYQHHLSGWNPDEFPMD